MSAELRDHPVERAAAAVRALVGAEARIAIVLGSGLDALATRVRAARAAPFGAVPGFVLPRVAGHAGELLAGTIAGVAVLVQRGRCHLYEGHSADAVALPVRVFRALGVETLIVTNAAGGIRPTLRPGDLMLIADHVNLMWRNPLTGPVRAGEQRFPDMSAPYDGGLKALARAAATTARVPLEEGTYVGLLGPSYETPAEIRMLERLGADAVGMSTVPEVLAARACGLRVLGVSLITNVVAGAAKSTVSHAEVLAMGARSAESLERVLRGVLAATS